MKKLLLLPLLIIYGIASAQVFTPIHNAQAPDYIAAIKYFGIPYGDIPTLNGTSRLLPGALFYATMDSSIYSWTGTQWLKVTTGIGGGSGGIDSATFHDNNLCFWDEGGSTCFDLSNPVCFSQVSADRRRQVFYNCNGDSLYQNIYPITWVGVLDPLTRTANAAEDSVVFGIRRAWFDSLYGGGAGASALQQVLDLETGNAQLNKADTITTNQHQLLIGDLYGGQYTGLITGPTGTGIGQAYSSGGNNMEIHGSADIDGASFSLGATNQAGGFNSASIFGSVSASSSTIGYTATSHTFNGYIINNADTSTAPFNVVTIDENNQLRRAAYPSGGGGAENLDQVLANGSTITTDRVVNQDGNAFSFSNGSYNTIFLQGNGRRALIGGSDGTAESYLDVRGDIDDESVRFTLSSSDGVNTVQLRGNGLSNNISYTAGTHTFTGAIINNADTSTAPFNIVTIDENNQLRRAALPTGGSGTLQQAFDGSVAASDNPVISTGLHSLTIKDLSGGTSFDFIPNDGHIKLTTTSGKYIRVADDDNDISLHYDNDYNLKVENGGTTVTGPIFNNADTSTTPVNLVTIDPSTNELKRAAYPAAGITALTGDVTGSGSGSVATTLATVNSNVGTFNNITINAKGLATAGSNLAYLLPADSAAMLSSYKTSYPRQAISLTTTGSGASTYNGTTGVFNIPTPATYTVASPVTLTAGVIGVDTNTTHLYGLVTQNQIVKYSFSGQRDNDGLKFDSTNNRWINFRRNFTSPLAYNYSTNTLSLNNLDSTSITDLHSETYYNGKYWKAGGNQFPAGTVLGTTGNTSFRMIVNGTQFLHADSSSKNVGIGNVATTTDKLSVTGTIYALSSGGVSYSLDNGSAIRWRSGSSVGYIDVNPGTLNLRATTVAVQAILTGSSSISSGTYMDANKDWGYRVGGLNFFGIKVDSSYAVINNNVTARKILYTAENNFMNDDPGGAGSWNGSGATSALLEMRSTTRAFLPPRMTKTQRDAIVKTGISGMVTSGIVSGSGYSNGNYPAVALTGGSGSGATAKIVVNGGAVTQVSIIAPGTGYAVNDVLSSSSIGGGSGFTYTVGTLSLTPGAVIYQTDNTPGIRIWNGTNWMRFTETAD